MDEAFRISGFDLDMALTYTRLAYEMAGELGDPVIRLNSIQTLGAVYLYKGMNAEGILLYENALDDLGPRIAKTHPQRIMRLHNNLGGGYYAVGDFDGAIREFSLALEFAEDLEDQQSTGLCYQNIGACFQSLNRPEMAEEFFLKSLEIKEELADSNYIVSTYISLIKLEIEENKDYEKAREYLDKALEIALLIENKRDEADVLYRYGILESELGEWEKAAVVLEEALSISSKTGDLPQRASILGLYGNVLFHQGKLEEAEVKLRLANELSEEMLALERSSYAKYWLVEVLAAKGDSGQALRVQQAYQEELDSLRTQEIRKEIASAEARFNVLKARNAFEEERKEKEVALRNQYAILMISLIVLSLLLLLVWRERKLRSRQAELDKVKLQSFTRRLSEKNALILELQEAIPAPDEEEPTVSYSELLQMRILTDGDWQEFKLLFDRVYPGLIPKVRKRFQSLSQGDQRLFLLLKLRLSNKEIAGMLGISAQGVKVARHRLRKKLELETGESLQDFVESV